MASSEETVREAFEALARGDMPTMLASVAPDLRWTYLDPSEAEPQPRVCHGRDQLQRWAGQVAPGMTLEEVVPFGEQVVVVTRAPGLDTRRGRATGDRIFHVVTVKGDRVVALRACRSREEAGRLASEQPGWPGPVPGG